MSDVEADLVIGLRRLARVEGTPGHFELKLGDVAFEVDYVGGSSSRLTLEAFYDRVAHAEVGEGGREAGYRKSAKGGALSGIRPMAITLRGESFSDKSAKTEGLSREHQTGDDAFDKAIYIDSPTTDAKLLDGVLSEAVRAATLELVSLGFDRIVLDDEAGKVTALISGFAALEDSKDAPGRVAKAFATLLSGLPPVSRAPGAHPEKSALPAFLAIMGGFALVIGGPIGLFGIAGSFGCTESSGDGEGQSLKDGCHGQAGVALIIGLFAGFFAMIIARTFARPRVAGHSDSHRRLFHVGAAAFAWGALLAFLLTAYFGYASTKV